MPRLACHECQQPKTAETRHEYVGHWPDDVYHRTEYCHPRVVAALRAKLESAERVVEAFAAYWEDFAGPIHEGAKIPAEFAALLRAWNDHRAKYPRPNPEGA